MPKNPGTMVLDMRTTLTLDDDVALLLQEAAHRTRTTVKQVVNSALRAALAPPAAQRAPYRETVHHAELAPGLDLTGFNKLADELEDEAIIGLAQQ
jgi:Arc/MetJ family transcription regulator